MQEEERSGTHINDQAKTLQIGDLGVTLVAMKEYLLGFILLGGGSASGQQVKAFGGSTALRPTQWPRGSAQSRA